MTAKILNHLCLILLITLLACCVARKKYVHLNKPTVVVENVNNMSTMMQSDAIDLLQESLLLMIGKPGSEQVKYFQERYKQKYSDYKWDVLLYRHKTFNLYAMKSIELSVGPNMYLLYASLKE